MREITDLLHNRFVQLGIACITIALLFFNYSAPQPLVLSRWSPIARQAAGVLGLSQPTSAPARIIGTTHPIATPMAPGSAALEEYNQSSVQVESVADGAVQLYKRSLLNGSIVYMVVRLNGHTHLEVLTADGATLGSDASGDTIWTDHGHHLRTVEEITRSPLATRTNMTLLGAMAFGFHGGERTSDEGTVVIDSTIQRMNAGRSALCIRPNQRAAIGVFSQQQASECEQAAGAGPIVMQRGKIVNPGIANETDQFLPFNPLGEDFTQLDWRKNVFSGDYPKTMIGVGRHMNGDDYLVLLVSYGLDGIQAAGQLKAMGCTEAIGGDDDTSTQLVWRGNQVIPRNVRSVPTAIGIYVRGKP